MATEKDNKLIREEYHATAAEVYDAALAANTSIQRDFSPEV